VLDLEPRVRFQNTAQSAGFDCETITTPTLECDVRRFDAGARGEKGALAVFGVLRRGQTDPFRGPRKHPALQTRLTIGLCLQALPTIAFSDGQVYVTVLLASGRDLFRALVPLRN